MSAVEAESSPTSSVAEVIDVDLEVSPSEFHPSLSEDERRFYTRAYPNVDMVRERKVHCTTCKMHIGTAPAQENNIKMHPVLRVTHCNKCHDFYNSGEFSKGEDGSELYCRWCGQGGEVYCCSNCPYVFCKSCIMKNLSRGVVTDIEQNENWSCFNCAPKILWPLRAQHWALIKYIDKQKKEIASMGLLEAELKQHMMKDRSTCCRLAKAKCSNISDSMESVDSTSRRSVSATSTGSTSKKVHKLSPRSVSPAAKRVKQGNDEVVCTPDLLSMLEPDCQITVPSKPRPPQSPMASSPKVMSIQTPIFGGSNTMQTSTPKNTPPPLVLRNTSVQMRPLTPSPVVRRTVVGPRTPTAGGAAPVYHTINGYRIDLNSAAQQETFRLPNGKLIQVKRQGSSNNASSSSVQPPITTPQQPPNTWQRVHMQHHPTRPVHIAPAPGPQPYPQISIRQNSSPQHPQMLRYQNTTAGNTTVTTLQNGSPAQVRVINGPVASAQQHAAAPPPQQPPQSAMRPLMVRFVFPDTAIGHARSQLQDQVFNAMDICQHLTGKVQTLTNSNAYKQARNYLEVKELYIHLSYLLTYAIGRFKGLQDKCLGDMRQLGFVNDADSLENGQLAADKQASDDEDNEIEIVEPKTDTITLDSDNEDDDHSPVTPLNSTSSSRTPSQLSLALTGSTPMKTTEQTSISNKNDQEVEFLSNAQSFLASMLEIDLSEGDQNSAQASPNGGTSSSGNDVTLKKQPRKKTTNKPNPTLLKKQEILQRERLEEMKRNDMKLKMKCTIELKKAEEEYPFAKEMLDEGGEEDSNKKEDDSDEVVVLMVEDIDSPLEEDTSKADTDAEKEKNEDKETISANPALGKEQDDDVNNSQAELVLENKNKENDSSKFEGIEDALIAEHNENSQLTEKATEGDIQNTAKATVELAKTEENNKTQTEDTNKSGSKDIGMTPGEEEKEGKKEKILSKRSTENSVSTVLKESAKKVKLKNQNDESNPNLEKEVSTECEKLVYITVGSPSPHAELIPNSDAEIDVDKEIAKLLHSKDRKLDIIETAEKDVGVTNDLMNDINELIENASNSLT